MLPRSKPSEEVNQIPFKLKDVSYCVSQLTKHNNDKAGHWVAINGFVYDVTKIIAKHPELTVLSGTDITLEYIHLKDEFVQHAIGKLALPTDNKKKMLAYVLYSVTRVQNSIVAALEQIKSLNQDDYTLLKDVFNESSNELRELLQVFNMYIDEKAKSYLIQCQKNLDLLNLQYVSMPETSQTYVKILFQYKGLCNLIKFMFENYMVQRNANDVFENELNLLASTEQHDADNLSLEKTQSRNHDITIIGASICGLALAMQLKQLGIEARVYDKLDDPRVKYSEHSSASFNLLINERGLHALESLGLRQKFMEIAFPISGRTFHVADTDVRTEALGPENETLMCVRREDLVNMLTTEAEKRGIQIQFGVDCKSFKQQQDHVEIEASDMYNDVEMKINTNRVFGADGVHSVLRKNIEAMFPNEPKSIVTPHVMTYREFAIPANENNDFRFDPTKFNIWPRKGFTLAAFPNEDRSFSLTLFISKDHPELPGLQKDPECLAQFIKQNAPELSPVLEPVILNEPERRWGTLYVLDAKKWAVGDQMLLVGDAAHAFYPFNGQAANTALDDGLVLSKLIKEEMKHNKIEDNNNFNWQHIFNEFAKRKKFTDVLAKYSKKVNILDLTAKEYALQHRIELELMRQGVPSYFNAVSFTNMPYDEASKISQNHELLLKILFEILRKIDEPISDQKIQIVTKAAIENLKTSQAKIADGISATYSRSNSSVFWRSALKPINKDAALQLEQPIGTYRRPIRVASGGRF